MAKWRFDRAGTWVYPEIQVKASQGDVIESSYQIDEFWSEVDAATPATIDPPAPILPPYAETPDGATLVYSRSANKFVPSIINPFDELGRVNEEAVPERLGEPNLDLRYLTRTDSGGLVTSPGPVKDALDAKVSSDVLTFNVKDAQWGAKGDGVTNDSAAINAAILAANAAGGGSVFIPWSLNPYRVGNAIQMKSNVRLYGPATLKVTDTYTAYCILASNVNNVIIEDITIDMNNALTTNGGSVTNQQAIYASYGTGTFSGLTVRNVKAKNGWQRGIMVNETTTGQSVSDVVIERNTLDNFGDVSIVVSCVGNTDKVSKSLSSNFEISRNKITNPGNGGIQAFGVSDLAITRNRITSSGAASGHGICIGTSGTARHCTDFEVSGNTVRGFNAIAKWGIVVTVNGTRFEISSNIIDACAGGLSVDPEDGALQDVEVNVNGLVADNIIRNSVSSHGMNIRMLNNMTLRNNRCTFNALCGMAVSVATGVKVEGNVTKNNVRHGIAMFGTTSGGGHILIANQSSGNNTGAGGYQDIYFDPGMPILATNSLGIAGGKLGFLGATPVVKAASPGTATGTDAAVINAVVTALRNYGLIT